ncbi:MAG: tyrosine recombinase [Firmicutes bacterium]|jgi:integrase/recombinase XerD|nr:tyrosine recombinase [Bacillota bacterium]MBQ5797525.1 tyrosine recombinase [Bacillota bacterium]MBR6500188.1 tyrosine recombinase [Bacillota bacterium]
MEETLRQYTEYLEKEKNMAANTRMAYEGDVAELQAFLLERGNDQPLTASNTDLVAWMLKLKNDGRSGSTLNRKLAAVRGYYSFFIKKGWISVNPADNIKSPKVKRKQIEFLTVEEVEHLLEQPDKSLKGVRDQALLELLYAAGLRVTEAANANVTDLNLRIGFITCSGEHGKARIVPLGRPSREAIEAYVYDVRPQLLKDKDDDGALFLNTNGSRLTRQGVWKILKEYAQKAGLENRLSPQTLRNSFAVHMVQNGADLKSIQELMGHEDLAATQIYLTVTKNRIKEVYDRTHPRA